jgi:hypothetical protein
VSARKEEGEALREALSPGAWRRHRGGAAALIAVDRRSRATRRLGGNKACQRFACEEAGEGMRRHLIEGCMEHLGVGHGRNFTDGQRGEEQTQASSRRRRAAVTGCHGAPQPTRRLKVAGGHAVILVAQGGDGWTAR